MKNELQRIRDNLKCALNMGGLKGSAEWAVEELDRLLSVQVRYSIEDLQQEALNAGLQYVRESDDHYVTGTTEQALDFIRNMIGVDIRLTDAPHSLPATGSAVDRVVATAPERIYLIIGDDCPRDVDFSELGDVVWCEEEAEQGIEYVRAALSAHRQAHHND